MRVSYTLARAASTSCGVVARAARPTLEEARRHLGVETQRQWSGLAILRTTPALLGLFSVVTLLAHPQMQADPPVRRAAWYRKTTPTWD